MELQRPVSQQPIPSEAKRVFKGVVFDVYQWEQKQYDGTTKTFEKLKRADTVMVISTIGEKIMVVHQEQPGKKAFTGLPGGRVDEGEDIFEAAKRELLEETGYQSSRWSLLEAFQPITKVDWAIWYFIAQDAQKLAEPNLDSGEKIETKLLSFDDFLEFAISPSFGEIELKMRILEAKADSQKLADLKQKIFTAQ